MTSRAFAMLFKDIACRRDLTPAAKILHAILVDRIGTKGFCWCGVRWLAKATGLSSDGVMGGIAQLERLKLVQVTRRQSGRSNHYRLVEKEAHCPAVHLPEEKRTAQQNGSALPTSALAHCSAVQSNNKKDLLSNTAASDFDRFYEAYPKKLNRAAALAAFDAIPDKPSIDVLLAAIETARRSPAWKEQNGRFIPGPAKWLQDEQWRNYKPAASGTTASGLELEQRQREKQAAQRQASIEQETAQHETFWSSLSAERQSHYLEAVETQQAGQKIRFNNPDILRRLAVGMAYRERCTEPQEALAVASIS